MATRSTINILNDDGSVEGIYCHWDGHPNSVGKILMEDYDDEEKIRDLLKLGAISFLGPTTETGDTDAYHRDRGDEIWHLHAPDFSKQQKQTYNYLWKDDMWWVSENESSKLIPLDQIILEKKMEKFYPSINEVYNPEWMDFDIDDKVPTYLRKQFRDVVRLITTQLQDEGFSEVEIEDYLKRYIEQTV